MSSELLPPNATKMESAIADAACDALAIGVPLRDLWSPQRCPVSFLPFLAWTLSVDFWEPTWPESYKRAAIAESLAIHRIKGSLASIKRVLAAVGYPDAVIAEGMNAERYDGAAIHDGADFYGMPTHWATYRVYLSRPVTNEQADEVRAILDTVQPARCELVGLDFSEAPLLYNNIAQHDGAFNHGVA